LLNAQQKQRFEEDGYLLIPGVLNDVEVAKLRKALLDHFEIHLDTTKSEPQFLTDIFSRFPDIRWVLFHDGLLAALRELLGEDFAVLRESAVHLNNFSSGWHRDTHSQEQAGKTFHWNDDYLMVEAALYLQENDDEFGGGLDIYPGSHRVPDDPPGGLLTTVSAQRTRLFGDKGFVRVRSKPGDLVIFHFRARHRSTPSKHQTPPPDRQKIALFMACSRNNSYVDLYHDYLESRPHSYEYLKGFSYPSEMLDAAEKHQLTLP
jgi:hypothetical protein